MSVEYDVFTGAFLSKIAEFDLVQLHEDARNDLVDGYLKRAVSAFRKNCRYDLTSTQDDTLRQFDIDIAAEDLDELVDIISEGMVVQWLKPFLNRQELLENVLNTRDFTTYSPANLLLRVSEAHEQAKRRYTQMIREYSYNHGDLGALHL